MSPYAAAVPAPLRLALKAVDWDVAVQLANPVAAPAAQAVEAFLPSGPEPQISAWPAASALPRLTLAAAGWVIVAAMAEALPAPAAEAVEPFPPASWPSIEVITQLPFTSTETW
jgi:hypothetical protein